MLGKLEGVICAILTPFRSDDELDEERLRSHIEFLIGAGVHGLLFTGGCGEFLSLDDDERKRVMRIGVDQVRGRVPSIVGLLSPDTRHVCALARCASQVGADAVMVLPPYYINPSRAAVVDHYYRVADHAGLPIVVYNNPARTNVNLDAAMLCKLAEIDTVVACKDCDRNLTCLSEKIEMIGHRIGILSGEDDLAFPTLILGAKGGIWATVNLVPHMFAAMYQAVIAGQPQIAQRFHYQLLPLWQACFVENHPAALKKTMALASMSVGKARSPLDSLTEEQVTNVRSAWEVAKHFV